MATTTSWGRRPGRQLTASEQFGHGKQFEASRPVQAVASLKLAQKRPCRGRAPKRWSCVKTEPVQWLAAVILVVATVGGGGRTTALKVSVAIPDLVGLYEAFWLNCSHSSPIFNKLPPQTAQASKAQSQPDQQQPERIYSIRWYKDNDEFYRYMPGDEPHALHLEAKGVQADVSTSLGGPPLGPVGRLARSSARSFASLFRKALMIY